MRTALFLITSLFVGGGCFAAAEFVPAPGATTPKVVEALVFSGDLAKRFTKEGAIKLEELRVAFNKFNADQAEKGRPQLPTFAVRWTERGLAFQQRGAVEVINSRKGASLRDLFLGMWKKSDPYGTEGSYMCDLWRSLVDQGLMSEDGAMRRISAYNRKF